MAWENHFDHSIVSLGVNLERKIQLVSLDEEYMNTLSLIEASFRKPGDFNSFYPFVEISTVHSERR